MFVTFVLCIFLLASAYYIRRIHGENKRVDDKWLEFINQLYYRKQDANSEHTSRSGKDIPIVRDMWKEDRNNLP